MERATEPSAEGEIISGNIAFDLTFSEPVTKLQCADVRLEAVAPNNDDLLVVGSHGFTCADGDITNEQGNNDPAEKWSLAFVSTGNLAYFREVKIALPGSASIADAAGNDLIVADADPMPNEMYEVVLSTMEPMNLDNITPTVFIGPQTTRTSNPFEVQVRFSEPVTGFDPEDETILTVEGGEIMSFTPSGTGGFAWTLTILGETSPVTVTLLAGGAVRDEDSTPRALASDVSQMIAYSVRGGAEQAAAIADYLQRRGAHIMAARPDLIGLLDGSGIGASSLNFNEDAWGFEFSASGREMADLWGKPRLSLDETDPAEARGDYWVSIRGIRADSGDNRDDFYSLSVGAHRRLDENRILGGFVAIDQMDSDLRLPGATEDGTLEGGGWLAGPYLVGRVADRGLYYEAHAAWGQSSNEFSADGSAEDEFDTDRYLVGGSLKGEYEMQGWTLRPVLSADWFREEQEAYRNASGREMEEQSITLGEVRAGPEFGRVVAMDNGGDLSVDVGVYGVASLAVDADDSEPETFDDGDFRGRVKLDLGYVRTAASAAEVGLGLYYDGIGQVGYESYGVDLRVRVAF